MRLIAKSSLCVLVLAGSTLFAQPWPAPTPSAIAPALAQPESPPSDLPTQDQVATLLVKARASYRKGVVAEHITLRVSFPGGREASSAVTLLLDNGIPALNWPRRLKIELGRLTIAADDHALIAINSQDPGTYFRAELPEGLTPEALRSALPPIPLPQLAWALSGTDEPIDPANAIPGAGPVTWNHQTTESRDHQFTFSGDAPGGKVQLTIDQPSGCLVRISAPYGSPAAAGQSRLDIDVAQIPPAEVPPADQWGISTLGRAPVGFLAELKGRPSEIAAGDRLPALSLMTLDLDSASLQEVLTPHAPGPTAPARDSFGALVLYRVSDPAASADARAGARATADLKSLLAAQYPDASKRPRLVAMIVASMELQEFTRARLGDIDKEWAKESGAPERAFSPTGNAILARLADKAGAALIIVDEDQRVLKVIPLDGRAGEDAAIAQEALGVIVRSLGPLP